MSQSNVNRREALSLTAASALAGTATVASIPQAEASPRLAELGRRFDTLYPKWLHVSALDRECGRLARALAEERAGVVGVERMSDAEAKRLLKELGRAEQEINWPPISDEWERVTGELEALAKEALALPTLTSTDLAIKIRLATVYCCWLWSKDFDGLEIEQFAMQQLVEAALALSGLPIPYDMGEAQGNA